MKKVLTWVASIAFVILLINWAVLGIKLFSGNYDVLMEAYIGAACFPVFLICIVTRKFSEKCPYCGKNITFRGAYCPYCGKKL